MQPTFPENSSKTSALFTRLNRWLPRPAISTETLIICASLYFTIVSNSHFWKMWFVGRNVAEAKTWFLFGMTAILLTAIHSLILGLVVTRRTAKPVLALLLIATGLAMYYMDRYTVYFDVSMVRNIFNTDVKEARELFAPGMLGALLVYGILPAILVWRMRFKTRSLGGTLLRRVPFMAGALILAIGSAGLSFQDLSALMRNQKEMRYLITPANFIVSTMRLAATETAQANTVRTPVGSDASLAAAWNTRGKPLLLVVVVGETARAANWGLNGYARQTTPLLSTADVINFPHVESCGTNTEVSLPCMFSPFGRKNYDESKIRGHESVLHVFEHGGIKTLWRDNQSGCKGVCDKLEVQRSDPKLDPRLCSGDHCLDEVLLTDLEGELKKNPRGMVLVLHQLGNHGPAYSQRYPQSFARFTPVCETADLGKCSREQIVNAYDNALLYTDHFLNETIRRLKSQTSHDAAMIYVSDHGESLGEKGIFLHGLPYAIAPREQTQVPMVMWLSQGFSKSTGLDVNCIKTRAQQELTHDYLFHTMLGLMQVNTSVYDKAFDFSASCRT